MEVIFFVAILVFIGMLISYLFEIKAEREQVRQSIRDEAHGETTPYLPRGVRTNLNSNASGYDYSYEEDEFFTSMAIGMATDSALAGTALGGNFAGAMIGAAIADSEQPTQILDDNTCDPSSSTDNSCDDSSYDSSSSDSSYDSGSSDSSSGGD